MEVEGKIVIIFIIHLFVVLGAVCILSMLHW